MQPWPHCFKSFGVTDKSRRKSWSGAVSHCKRKGASLTSIVNEEENTFLLELTKRRVQWLGLDDAGLGPSQIFLVGWSGTVWHQVKQSGQMANQTITITKNTASCWKEQNGRTGTARRRKGSLVRGHLKIPKVFL